MPAAQSMPAPKPSRPAWLVPALAVGVLVLAAVAYFATRPSGPPATITTPTGAMVLVPAGPFLSGEKKETASALPAFYIDKTEVSNGAYAAFLNATGRKQPENFSTDPHMPVVSVSILDAQAFAKWAGKRLPNAREWEKAARGTDGRIYPWGDTQDASKANINSKNLRPVTDFAGGASPFGALNMVGNVWELVDQLSTPSEEAIQRYRTLVVPSPGADEPWYQIRGLSFNDPWDPGAVWDAGTIPARFKSNRIGFRCVRDVQ
jgi:eukaryotic-like serine/threonine-protein kinase